MNFDDLLKEYIDKLDVRKIRPKIEVLDLNNLGTRKKIESKKLTLYFLKIEQKFF